VPAAVAVPIAAAVIGAGGSLVAANQQKQATKPLIHAQTDLARQQQQNAATLQPYIGEFYSRARGAYDPAAAYYTALASGDRDRILGAVSPELATIGTKYGSVIRAARALNPRSGASASYNTDLGFRAADEQQRAINEARTSAYPNLVKMSGVAGDLGAGAAGLATQAGQGASGMFGSAINSRNALANSSAAAYGQAARTLYDAYSTYRNSGSGSSNGKGSAGGAGGLDSTGGTGGSAWNGD
jgi:hypothetical protein